MKVDSESDPGEGEVNEGCDEAEVSWSEELKLEAMTNSDAERAISNLIESLQEVRTGKNLVRAMEKLTKSIISCSKEDILAYI